MLGMAAKSPRMLPSTRKSEPAKAQSAPRKFGRSESLQRRVLLDVFHRVRVNSLGDNHKTYKKRQNGSGQNRASGPGFIVNTSWTYARTPLESVRQPQAAVV